MKPFAITLDSNSSLANLTGSWRTQRPVYVDRLPPCNNACPAGENIQQWLFHAEEGDYRRAWEEIMENNPLPAVMGRVCYHLCESACNRGTLDETVGIHAVERFLGDQANKHSWTVPVGAQPSGKKVLVIGSGPAGLSAAYHLTRMGHQVVVHEAAAKPGGMMRYGIPKYRLPRGTLDADINRIRDMGVQIHLNMRTDDIVTAKAAGQFDAVFVAIGAQKPRAIDLPTQGNCHIVDAIEYLASLETDAPLALGKKVAVYGGGNTAMDAARSALRMGAEVTVYYRGPRERMPAHEFEIREAVDEGATLAPLHLIRKMDVTMLLVEQAEVGPDGKVQGTGRLQTVAADSLLLAVGQLVETALVDDVPGVRIDDGVIAVGSDMSTGLEGVFAGGDMVAGNRTVTTAIGHGKRAARHIDAWLRGTDRTAPEKHELASPEKLNTWYYSDAPKTVQPVLDVVRRQSGFEEVLGDLDETNALFEARRCLSCGNCFECDNCYGVCPDNAVVKLGYGNRYRFNYDYCKGCMLCVQECPCGAIAVAAETI